MDDIDSRGFRSSQEHWWYSGKHSCLPEAPKRRDLSSWGARTIKVNFMNVGRHELGIRAWLVFDGQRCSCRTSGKNNSETQKQESTQDSETVKSKLVRSK